MNSKEGSRRHVSFSAANILGDPFVLVTVSVSILAWLIAFIASIVSDSKTVFPHFAWWTVVYMLFNIIAVTLVFLTDSAHTYHVAIVGFLSAGLVFTTSAVNSLIYESAPYKEAAAAGHILLSMVSIVWIFYFGSQPQAAPRSYVDSFALNKGTSIRQSAMPSYINRAAISPPTQQMYGSQHLNGFETTSPVSSGFEANKSHVSASHVTNLAPQPATTYTAPSLAAPTQTADIAPSTTNGGELVPPTEYPYKAKAIYSYDANPEDSNEISFSKHEVLEVSDVSGRWWQARKENGETGIAPSNYLILL